MSDILKKCFRNVDHRTTGAINRAAANSRLPRVPWKDLLWHAWQGHDIP